MPIPALAELQQPQLLFPMKLQSLPVACDEGFACADFSGNKSRSSDKSHPHMGSSQRMQQCINSVGQSKILLHFQFS